MPPTKVAFVCVQNAGRSQMAAAFAERERAERRADEDEREYRDSAGVEVITGGTDPADHVHDEVVEVMQEVNIDLSERMPREVTPEELEDCDYVITTGCSTEDACPAAWAGENRDWELDDPDGRDLDAVRAIRDEIEERVATLFEELGD